MRLKLCACFVAVLFSSVTAWSQAGVYVLFTGANLDSSNTVSTRIYGPTFGLYANFPTPVVKFGGDVRAALLNGQGTRNYYAVTGPRLEVDRGGGGEQSSFAAEVAGDEVGGDAGLGGDGAHAGAAVAVLGEVPAGDVE